MVDQLQKAPSGIKGLDELTGGGFPAGRPTLICGGPGCGKTLLAVTFLVHGALDCGEPGVFISFDERTGDLAVNVASLGFDLPALESRELLVLDHVHLDRQQIQEAGEYDLEGLFVRLDFAAEKIGARRVVLDSIDTLFAGIPNAAVVRSELRRLFDWLKEHGLSTMITAERGDGSLTRHGIEEYVSDCVILLDHRVIDDLSTRRLRVVKYRGSAHGTNEYPFLIDSSGITVMPVTSLGLTHVASTQRVPTGLAGLDSMLDYKGYYKGSSILVGGGPGTGKTSIAAQLADVTCKRGERCIFFSFEESPNQLARNMRSIGIDLQRWRDQGLLHCISTRPSLQGLEMHLALMLKQVQDFHPDLVIVDPLSALMASGTGAQTHTMLLRLIDYLKAANVTALFLSLQQDEGNTALQISSIMDTWIIVRNVPSGNALVRQLHVVKSRGMPHSSRVRRMEITNAGIELTDIPEQVGPDAAGSSVRLWGRKAVQDA